MNKIQQEMEFSLFRILSFDRLVEIFQSRELFISHPSNWEDPYETILKHKYSDGFFAQCWCKNGNSDAMWRIYSPNQLAVRIRIKRDMLEAQLNAATMKLPFRFMIKDVKYLPQMKIETKLHRVAKQLETKFNADIAAGTLFLKRIAFSHEAEVRLVVYPSHFGTESHFEKGFRVPVDPYELIRGVVVDPRAPEAYVEAYKHYLRAKLGYRRETLKSLLYHAPKPVEI
jgi:hypothetical protein